MHYISVISLAVVFVTSLHFADKAMRLVLLHNISSVPCALDFGSEFTVMVAVLGRRQELQCCHPLEVVGDEVYIGRKQILEQLLFVILFFYLSLFGAAAEDNLVVHMYACNV